MVELRWIRRRGSFMELDEAVLQWREVEEGGQGAIEIREWTDVPIVEEEE